jgi:hypothetical protein
MAAHKLPAVVRSGTLTELPDAHLVPALIADAGEPAAWRYVEFFTATSVTRIRAVRMPERAPVSSPGARIAG